MSSNEAVGPTFDPEKFKAARQRVIQLVHECARQVKVGMSEADGHQILKDALIRHGSERLWHPSKVRFAQNTLKTFREPSEPGVVIKAGDHFFFDIGPVFDGHESDYGETFVCQAHNDDLADASKDIYLATAKVWREQNLTGQALYTYAQEQAHKRDYQLNPAMKGHRLSDFPHALHFKGSLPEHEKIPVKGLWVLEIHLRHLASQRGSFFEDILQ